MSAPADLTDGGARTADAEPAVAVAETTTAVVFFVGDRAYKMKKPVDLGYVDFRERRARLSACRREVDLNRRLAPDVYLGVASVLAPGGKTCEHLVVMRRLPASRRLATLVREGRPVEDQLLAAAHQIATLHASSRRSPAIDAVAGLEETRERWRINASRMAHLVGPLLDPVVSARVAALVDRYLAGRAALFAARLTAGCARDGHGDLLAEDVFCLDDGPRVLDCLEFDDRLRYGDVLSDVAFLAMDLEHLGRPDLGRYFLDQYRECSAASWPGSLEHHYVAYRAQVRALVHGLRWEQSREQDAGSAARALLALALGHLESARVRLVVVGGAPGTGKTTVARALAESVEAVVLSSDELRKQRAGLDITTPAAAAIDSGLYVPEATEATYDELLSLARRLLAHGESVVLDASFALERHRQAARSIADELVADLVELRCVAPTVLTAQRLSEKGACFRAASDADPAIGRALAERQEPWQGALTLDTSAPLESTVAAALEMLRADDTSRPAVGRARHGHRSPERGGR